MKRIAITSTIIIIIACGFTISFCDIKFNTGSYDIIFSSRRNNNCSLGLNYKEGFEVWQFAENVYGGCAIYPR